MKDTTFSSLEETRQWVQSKVDECARVDKPPKLHSNFFLSEWWYTHDLGQDAAEITQTKDTLERAATELGTAVQTLSSIDDGKKNKKSNEDRHRQLVSKVQSSSQKLGKLISQAESKLPGLRRQLDGPAFSKFRAGVAKCREARESSMDALEDRKLFVVDKCSSEYEDDFKVLTELSTTLAEHWSALHDALQVSQQEPAEEIKAEPPLATAAPATEDEAMEPNE